MKTNKKEKVIKELSMHFEEDFKKTLPISILPNGNVVYRNYIIEQNKQGDWTINNSSILDPIGTFYLKTSALMAAKAYDRNDLNRMFEIEQLDRDYKKNHSDSLIFANNLKKTKDFDRYLILLNKLENSNSKVEHFKEQISKMFKYSFV